MTITTRRLITTVSLMTRVRREPVPSTPGIPNYLPRIRLNVIQNTHETHNRTVRTPSQITSGPRNATCSVTDGTRRGRTNFVCHLNEAGVGTLLSRTYFRREQ